jgi:hypothetical protein
VRPQVSKRLKLFPTTMNTTHNSLKTYDFGKKRILKRNYTTIRKYSRISSGQVPLPIAIKMDTRITFKPDKKHKYYLSYTQMYNISNIKAYSQHEYPKSIPAWTRRIHFESEKVLPRR